MGLGFIASRALRPRSRVGLGLVRSIGTEATNPAASCAIPALAGFHFLSPLYVFFRLREWHFRNMVSNRRPGTGGSSYLSWLWRSFTTTSPLYQYFRQAGISSSRNVLAEEAPVSSPLGPALIGTGKTEQQKATSKASQVQAVLKGIKQSPKKVNLVATLVRGMRVEDALLQLQVTVKRASKAVYQVIHSARANATHNHGLDADRLLVAEAFVGKGYFKKRVSYHARGRAGVMHRPECRLTVVVRETTPEEEAKIARLKVHNFRKRTKQERKLVPHKLIETTPIWNRRGKADKANRGETSVMPA